MNEEERKLYHFLCEKMGTDPVKRPDINDIRMTIDFADFVETGVMPKTLLLFMSDDADPIAWRKELLENRS